MTEPSLRQALAIDEQKFGPNHPDVARDLKNLAQLLQATGRKAEAEPLLRRALVILLRFQKRNGAEHPDYQSVNRSYMDLLHDMGVSNYEASERVRAVRREVL